MNKRGEEGSGRGEECKERKATHRWSFCSSAETPVASLVARYLCRPSAQVSCCGSFFVIWLLPPALPAGRAFTAPPAVVLSKHPGVNATRKDSGRQINKLKGKERL